MCLKSNLVNSLPEFYSVEKIILSILKNFFSKSEIHRYFKQLHLSKIQGEEHTKFQLFKDLYNSGMTGAYIAYSNFNSEKGKFISYAYNYIKHEIFENYNLNKRQITISLNTKENREMIKISKENKRQKKAASNFDSKIDYFLNYKEVSTNEDFDNNKLGAYELDEEILLSSAHDNNLKHDEILDLKNLVNKLSRRDKNIIIARYFDNKTLEDIANMEGVSKEAIRKCENRAIKNLQQLVI